MLLKKVSIILVTAAILVACNIYTLIPLYHPIANDFQASANDIIFGNSFFTFFMP
jgi:MFS transporter, YNFM family, putative membrane transport protein